MTMVVKEASVEHRTRSQGESAVYVVDPETSECLYYESILGHPRKKKVNIPREVLASRKEVEIRYDLIDCSIDVCSAEVPSLFQDNFDYLDIRRDFVHGVLTSDLLMKNIHLYFEKDGYAARVRDTKSYESVSKDILSRWTFPLVPDDNYPGRARYEHSRGNRYLPEGNTAVLSRTCTIGTNTLIGAAAQVGDNAQVKASVIGPNCIIGPNSIIEDSYIFQGTIIGADCKITRSIIGANADIKDGSVVQKGCLVGDDVVLGPGARLDEFERVSAPRANSKPARDNEAVSSDEEDSDIEEVEALQDSLDKSSLGSNTNVIVWPDAPPEDEDDDSDDENPENYTNQRFMRLGDDIKIVDTFPEAEGKKPAAVKTHAGSMAPRDADKEFRSEVVQSLERAFAENHSLDNAAVELKTLRMASNVPLSQVKDAVVATLVDKIAVVEEGGVAQRKEVLSVIGRWGQLINRLGGLDSVETITMLQLHCVKTSRLSLFGQILATMYQDDIVEEEDIYAWHRLPSSRGAENEGMEKTWSIGAQLIAQLAEQDSDSDEEDDEDDSE